MKTFKLSIRTQDHGKTRFQVLDGVDVIGSIVVDVADADALVRNWKGEIDMSCYRGGIKKSAGSSQSKMAASLLKAFQRGRTKAVAGAEMR
jgi:hypothetical protein